MRSVDSINARYCVLVQRADGYEPDGPSRRAGSFSPPLPQIRNACFLPIFQK